MDNTFKDLWTERCARRLVELYPLLRPRTAAIVARELWEGDRGHIPPEEWAEIEVKSWGKAPAPAQKPTASIAKHTD